jgi:hypothetical protein
MNKKSYASINKASVNRAKGTYIRLYVNNMIIERRIIGSPTNFRQ